MGKHVIFLLFLILNIWNVLATSEEQNNKFSDNQKEPISIKQRGKEKDTVDDKTTEKNGKRNTSDGEETENIFVEQAITPHVEQIIENKNNKKKVDLKEDVNIKATEGNTAYNEDNNIYTNNIDSRSYKNDTFIERTEVAPVVNDDIQPKEKEKTSFLKNLFNKIQELAKRKERKFYHIALKEEHFRWSIPLYIGSNKKVYDLHVVTSTPHTAIYCSMGSIGNEIGAKVKYDLTESEDGSLIECRSSSCEMLKEKTTCLPLNTLLPTLNGFVVKKKKCDRRFCDYVHDINFLNLRKITNSRNLPLCTFDYSVGYDNVKGFYFRDSFFIQKESKQFYNYFGCITENDDLKLNDKNSGFIGLHNHDLNQSVNFPSILNSFIEKSVSKKNVFAMCLIENGGFITFGGYETSVIKAETDKLLSLKSNDLKAGESNVNKNNIYDIIWVSYSNPNKNIYKLVLTKISIFKDDETKIETDINQDVVVDSYNYFLFLPRDFVMKLKALIQTICQNDEGGKCEQIHEKEILTISDGNIYKYPKLEFLFNQHIVYIEPNDYIIKMSDNEYKILVKESNVPKLGVPFFLNKYLVFDNSKKKLGVARSDCKLNILPNDLKGIDMRSSADMDNNVDTQETESKSFYEKHKMFIITAFVLLLMTIVFGGIAYFL